MNKQRPKERPMLPLEMPVAGGEPDEIIDELTMMADMCSDNDDPEDQLMYIRWIARIRRSDEAVTQLQAEVERLDTLVGRMGAAQFAQPTPTTAPTLLDLQAHKDVCLGYSRTFDERINAEQHIAIQRFELMAALRKYEDAWEDMFAQCCSNPITNAWGKQVNLALMNEAHEAARSAIAQATHTGEKG
jgi:hypothetical protein